MTYKTPAQLKSEITSSYPDNNAGAISAALLRGGLNDIVDSFGSVVVLGITRAQIPNQAIAQSTIMVTGYSTADDLGVGAIYTSTGATSGGLKAIQDGAGTWFNLLPTEDINVGWFGAAGNGSTDDTAAVAAAIAAAQVAPRLNSVFLPQGDYLVTSLSNPMGIAFNGPGRILTAITGGYQQLNSYGDKYQYVIGREYLSYFHLLLITSQGGANSTINVLMSGDSTIDAGTTTIWQLVSEMGKRLGFRGVTGVSAGHSGQTTVEWLSTYLAADLATIPHLYLIRWGINDPDNAIHNLTAAQFITNVRTGLATIRASRDYTQLSVIIQAPSSVADTPTNRDERWFESVIAGLKQAARDYQCCFVDTYAYLRDARNANDTMDGPPHIHPTFLRNMWISSLLSEVIFPLGLRHISDNSNVNISGQYETPTNAALPSTYRPGVSLQRATGAGWPYNGIVLTLNHVDNEQLQINFNGSSGAFSVRGGASNAWSSWIAPNEDTVGTWTPTIYGGTVAGTPTYSAQVGDYFLNSNGWVTVNFNVTITAKGGMTGTVNIGGLPFAIHGGGSDPIATCSFGRYSGITLTAGYTQLGAQAVSNNNLLLIQNGSGQSAASVDAGSIAAATDIYGSITYKTP